MTLEIVPVRRPAPAAPPRARRHRALPWLIAAGVAAQVCVRLWFARARTGPVANPDETGYLLAARLLAGGHGGDMSGNTFYQGGYPLLLTPAYWISHDPATAYTIVLAINAVIGAALFPLGYVAVRRLGLPRRAALPLAWAAALLPASAFFGEFALADAVLPTVVLAWVCLIAVPLAGDAGLRYVVAASGVAGFAAAVHSRGEVVFAVHLATLLGLTVAGVVRRRGTVVRAGVVGLAASAGAMAAAMAVNGRVRAELYPGGARDLAAILHERLTTGAGQAWALSGAAGQIWYLAVSTWGLGGVGLVTAAVVLVRRRTPAAERAMAAVLLAVTFGIAYASSAALPDEHRVGNYAYGRYLACVAVVYALVGGAALMRARLRGSLALVAAAAGVVAGTGSWVDLYAGQRLRTYKFIGFDFPETSFLTGDRGALHLTAASFAALGLLCGFLVLCRLPGAGTAAAAGGLAVTNLAALVFLFGAAPDRVRPASPLPGAPAGGVVADVSVDWAVRTMLIEPAWWTRIGAIDVRRDRPAPGVCTVVVAQPDGTSADASWPAHPAGWRPYAHRSWSIGWVAWHDPSCDTARGR